MLSKNNVMLYTKFMAFFKRTETISTQQSSVSLPAQVVFPVDTMKKSVDSSEKLALAVRKELSAASEVITRARIQTVHLAALEEQLKNVSASADGINTAIKEIDGFIDTENNAIQSVSSAVQQISASL